MTRYTFSLQLSADEYQSFYRGTAHNIIVMSHQGVSLQFPASAVRSFITINGIHGDFLITMDDDNKLLSVEKIIN